MITSAGKRIALPLLLACACLSACSTPEAKDTGAATPEVAKTGHVPTSVAISIAQMKFNPDTVTIQQGDTVIFTNNDVVDHDATALPDSAWTSGPLHPGDSWRLVPGASTEYFCSIHVVMRGDIVVE